jgi:hypothetical protein
MLSQAERAEVRAAILAYGYLGRRAIEPLRAEAEERIPFDLLARAAVEDPSTRTRWMSLQLLDHYDDHRHDDWVVRALADPVPKVRLHAAHALGCDACSVRPGPVDPVPPLIQCILEDTSTKVRRQAMAVLLSRRIDDRVREAFTRVAAEDPDERMRVDAGKVLAHLDAGAR